MCVIYAHVGAARLHGRKMRESSVEGKLREGVRALGGICYKWVSPGQDGVPDRIIVMPGGRLWFVELKKTDGVLSSIQRVQIERLKALGFSVRVLYGPEEVAGFLKELRHGV